MYVGLSYKAAQIREDWNDFIRLIYELPDIFEQQKQKQKLKQKLKL
jgi:hypothetical protein